MAQVTVKAEEIVASLDEIAKTVAKAQAWAKGKSGDVKLEIPEPYDHAVQSVPEKDPRCLAGRRIDLCTDLGILLGVLEAIKRKK